VESRLLNAPRLSDAPPGAAVRIIRITEEGEQIPQMLDFCHTRGIKPGASFIVLGRQGENIRLGRTWTKGKKDTAAEVEITLDKSLHIRYETNS